MMSTLPSPSIRSISTSNWRCTRHHLSPCSQKVTYASCSVPPNPSGGGGRSMPDGTKPEPGGWNRFAIEVTDLAATVDRLRKEGVHFRSDIVSGVGGKQHQERQHHLCD